MAKEKLIYIYPSLSSFVKKDIDFLSKHYQISILSNSWNKKWTTPFLMLSQFFYLLFNIRKAKAVFVMFGGYWALMPALIGRLMKRPVFIILGGTDCVSFPSINYGNLRKPILSRAIKLSYKMATCLLPVDESLVECDYTYYEKKDFKKQGYKFFFPDITTPYRVIFNGFDSQFFNEPQKEKKANSFISIASVSDNTRFVLKGIDKIVYLANTFKSCSFIVIGMNEKFVKANSVVPENLQFIEFLPAEKFVSYLNESEFYLQLSISEGFPNALCEAMLCNCIPIGSTVGAIPTIIGNTGFLMEHSEDNYLNEQFNYILKLTNERRKQLAFDARKRIVEKFPLSLREEKFIETIEDYSEK